MFEGLPVVDLCRQSLDATSASEVDEVLAIVAREPSYARLVHALASHCLRCGYVDLWHRFVTAALALPHVSPLELYMRGQAKIRLGDWSGWTDREARLLSPSEFDFQSDWVQQMRWATGAWDGAEDLTDQALLVFADGGLGDCVQMLRYVPLLAEMSREVILAVHPRCLPFAQHNLGQLATVVIRDVPYLHAFQRHTWLMSLAGLFRHIPPFVAFHAPHPIGRRTTRDGQMHLALCWAGSTNHPQNREDRYRSLSLEDLAPLFARGDVTWHSVQLGRWASQAAAYPSIIQPTVPMYNLAQTANVLAGLDGVVTIDTSVAHLAASLGIPTLLILSTLPDFRWETADTTAWYPTVRLIRQRVPGDWSGIVATLMATLDARHWLDVRIHERVTARHGTEACTRRPPPASAGMAR
ncbi:MAG TPA: glycosyltransferase family 9 protein [Gemmatimonadaceae bacterium]|nr:glycosyltransferase family 9 protein [Gemmatimonadaceae bacterium]